MSKRDVIRVEVTDVGGRFAKLWGRAPREARLALQDPVKKTCFAMLGRMRVDVPVGPDSPHIKDALAQSVRGLLGRVGVIEGDQPSKPGSKTTLAQVALHNEYAPNKQPFMRPAAEKESIDFGRRATRALQGVERSLGGVGL